MKRLTLLLLTLLPLVGAAQKITLQCTFDGLPQGSRIIVSEPDGSRLMAIDTLTPNRKGAVKMERFSDNPVMAILTLEEQQGPMLHVLMLPDERITMEVAYMPSINFFNITDVKGSENMALYKTFTNMQADLTVQQNTQAMAPALKALLEANPGQLMSAFLVTYFEQAFDQYASLYKTVRDAQDARWKGHDFVRHLDSRLRSVLLPGMDAPDIELPDPEGKTRRLSDLRGKVVLIDFWASWCRPCRAENPNVVRLYGEYHPKGLEIFSVSLDNNRDAWLNAIKSDGLSWPNHVSDLRGWSSAGGRLYGISSIPATVLVDREGKIVARNLRGKDLENKLKEIFDK